MCQVGTHGAAPEPGARPQLPVRLCAGQLGLGAPQLLPSWQAQDTGHWEMPPPPGQQRCGPCSGTAHHQDGCTAIRNPPCPGKAGMGPTATPTTKASATTWLPLRPTGPRAMVAPQDQSHSAAGPWASLQLLGCLLEAPSQDLCQVKAASGLQGPTLVGQCRPRPCGHSRWLQREVGPPSLCPAAALATPPTPAGRGHCGQHFIDHLGQGSYPHPEGSRGGPMGAEAFPGQEGRAGGPSRHLRPSRAGELWLWTVRRGWVLGTLRPQRSGPRG